ncbi:MAG: hypothetical protein E6Q97_24495 [Desulfurellales bacterium]|nr:MAG: hypothetical protein E6Q97_24495 [Desulfurellales bacterium]
MASRLNDDLVVNGRVIPDAISYPPGSIQDDAVAAGADIDAEKLQHFHQPIYGQANTAAVDETRILHVAREPGVVEEFVAGSIAKAVGDATCTVDLRKNGTTVLTAVITLDSGNTNRVPEAGTLIADPSYVVGDVFEVVIDGTIGTGTLPTGVFCCAKFREDG